MVIGAYGVLFIVYVLQANKRLKEALDRQKTSRDRHTKPGVGGASSSDMSNLGTRVKTLITDDVEVMVSLYCFFFCSNIIEEKYHFYS